MRFLLCVATWLSVAHAAPHACVGTPRRCVAVSSDYFGLPSASERWLDAHCGGACAPLASDEWVVARQHWVPRTGMMVAVVAGEGATAELRKSLLPVDAAAAALGSRKSVGTGTVAAAVPGAAGGGRDGYMVVRHPHPGLADPTCGSYPPTPAPSSSIRR